MFGDVFFVNCGFQLYRYCQTLDVDFANVFRYFFTKFHLNKWPRGLVSPSYVFSERKYCVPFFFTRANNRQSEASVILFGFAV